MPTHLAALPRRVFLAVALAAILIAGPAARPAAASNPEESSARTAVETVLAEMCRAVLAGDADAYLACVATGDAVFLREQQMWAADLKRHVPEYFTLRIVTPEERRANEQAAREAAAAAAANEGKPAPEPAADAPDPDRPFEFTDSRAVFDLEMAWKISVPRADGEKGGPRVIDRVVDYPAVFEKLDGRWLFRGEHWVEVKTAPEELAAAPAAGASPVHQNLALCFPGFEPVAERIVELLPEVRAHVDEGFEQTGPDVQVVKIYPTMAHLQASIYLSYWDSLSGWNEPKEAIKVVVQPNRQKASLLPLLAHEYGHCVTFEMGQAATDMPWWVLEGVAELAAEKFKGARRASRGVNERVRKWAIDGELAEFAKISDFRNTPKDLMGHVYVQGQHMAGYVSERFGRTKRNGWLRAMANGATIDEATRKELGVEGGFAELDADWRADLASGMGEDQP